MSGNLFRDTVVRFITDEYGSTGPKESYGVSGDLAVTLLYVLAQVGNIGVATAAYPYNLDTLWGQSIKKVIKAEKSRRSLSEQLTMIDQLWPEAKTTLAQFNYVYAGLYCLGIHHDIHYAVEVIYAVYKALIQPGFIARGARDDVRCVMGLFKAWYPVVGLEMTTFLRHADNFTLQKPIALNAEVWKVYFIGGSIPPYLDDRSPIGQSVKDIQKVVSEYSLEGQAEVSISELKGVLLADGINESAIPRVANSLGKLQMLQRHKTLGSQIA
ncbi:hypothetical protein PG994_012660 [Apiospora phragmitis]|uniref:Uncharacterized protein n=1 Tax=Apiospora phragmitis TaxID=2905665 RepID=A0ABR1TBP1_9PEZI